jgi:hypothetical protein
MDVVAACGRADHLEVVSYKTTVRESGPGIEEAETRKVEKLYYNCGEGRFTRILSITDGELVRIEKWGIRLGAWKVRARLGRSFTLNTRKVCFGLPYR